MPDERPRAIVAAVLKGKKLNYAYHARVTKAIEKLRSGVPEELLREEHGAVVVNQARFEMRQIPRRKDD